MYVKENIFYNMITGEKNTIFEGLFIEINLRNKSVYYVALIIRIKITSSLTLKQSSQYQRN